MESEFRKRIGYYDDLEKISSAIVKDYEFGDFVSNNIVLIGYEDFNYVLETKTGKYFVKIFADFRTLNDCRRYVDIVKAALESGVSTPKLFSSEQGYLYLLKIANKQLRLCVMEYIDGKNYYTLGVLPTADEVRFLARQAAIINSMAIKPKLIYDHWAIVNFKKEFEERGKYLKPDDLMLLRPLLKEFDDLNIPELHHSFVHGDILTTNVIKDKHQKLWIIDFSVANYYPRIQELAVLACNLFFNADNSKKTKANLELALKEYQKKVKLTKRELFALPVYIKLAHAMHILCANYEKAANGNNSSENDYWYIQGKAGLTQTNI